MAGAFVEELARHLAAEQGAEVVVLAPGCAGAPARECLGRMEVRRFQYFWPAGLQRLAYGSGIPWNLRRSVVAWLNVPLFLWVFAANVCREGRRADVIHVHWGPAGALAALTRMLHGRPVVLTVHGTDWRSRMPLLRWLARWAVRHCDVVTTPSKEFNQEFRSVRDGKSGNCWIPNGVNIPPRQQADKAGARGGRESGGPCIVSVGRLISERRHDVLLGAFARVKEEFPGVTLVLVGDGPEREKLERLASELGISEAVEFTGQVPTWEVPQRLLMADLYVSATAVDGFGLAVVEAAAHGLPVVATPVGFAPEIVTDGETGYLVEPGDKARLAEAMALMLRDPEAMRKAGLRMRERVEERGLTWSQCARKMADIYRTVGGR